AEEAVQAADHLAVRQAALLVEFDDGGLGVGSQLSGSGAQGVGRLQGVASLNPPVALPALPDVDVELPVDGLAWDLDLELLGNAGLVEGAAAVGAAVRQRCLVDLIDLAGGGRLAMSLGAIVLVRLATGFPGLARRLALGEGSGLALAGALRLLQLAVQAFDLG